MNRALIAASSADSASYTEQLLRGEGFTRIASAFSGNEARRLMLIEPEPELILISSPLSDEFGSELSIDAAEYTSAAVILVCSGDVSNEISESLSAYGITVLPKNCSRQSLSEIIRAASEKHRGLHGSEKENADILTKIDEMRLISRAKCRLMQYLGFTENQAHKYIEKQAMNNRLTRKEAAEKILAAYEK